MTDTPLPRQIRIDRASVGLIGLDLAMNRVLADRKLARDAAVEQLFEAVARENYIPAGMSEAYRQALAREYDRLRSGRETSEEPLTIRILGPGCVSCNNLQKLVIEIMNDLGVAADVFQVHDLDEIGRFGVMLTPALVINGRVKSAGRLPSRSRIEEWIREEMER